MIEHDQSRIFCYIATATSSGSIHFVCMFDFAVHQEFLGICHLIPHVNHFMLSHMLWKLIVCS